jgi:hypothetical protein
MSVLLAPALPAGARGDARADRGGGATLEEALGAAWQQLRDGHCVSCPACGGRMQPEPGARGRCRDCGTTIS